MRLNKVKTIPYEGGREKTGHFVLKMLLPFPPRWHRHFMRRYKILNPDIELPGYKNRIYE